MNLFSRQLSLSKDTPETDSSPLFTRDGMCVKHPNQIVKKFGLFGRIVSTNECENCVYERSEAIKELKKKEAFEKKELENIKLLLLKKKQIINQSNKYIKNWNKLSSYDQEIFERMIYQIAILLNDNNDIFLLYIGNNVKLGITQKGNHPIKEDLIERLIVNGIIVTGTRDEMIKSELIEYNIFNENYHFIEITQSYTFRKGNAAITYGIPVKNYKNIIAKYKIIM